MERGREPSFGRFFMRPFAATTPVAWSLSKVGVVFLLASLGAGCGSSDGASPDGGNPSDARGSTDGRSKTDDAETTDGMSARDDRSMSDGGDLADGSDASDAEDEAAAGDAASMLPVNLGTAGNYVILAKSAISTVPTSAVTGDIGVSPAAATYITGFSPLTMASTNVFSTSSQVVGKVYAADYAVPTPSNLTTAVSDMQTAFTDAAGRAPDVTELGAGNIGGKTLSPGVYKWSTGLLIPTDITLAGSATDVWILQIAETLTVSSATQILLTGGAVSRNVFWQVAGSVDLGTTSHFEGIILGKTAISLKTGASINGRLLAQTAVSIDDSAVVEPAK
jgi:hypothetical protein